MWNDRVFIASSISMNGEHHGHMQDYPAVSYSNSTIKIRLINQASSSSEICWNSSQLRCLSTGEWVKVPCVPRGWNIIQYQ